MSLDNIKNDFDKLSKDVIVSHRVPQMRDFIQHGATTTFDHVVSVSYRAFAFARGLRISVDERSLVRGALLHDYYLYDWHDHEHAPDRWHGFTHPGHALRNAEEDFGDLTLIERDVISRHMFPFHPLPPTTREGWLVCLADKICTVQEFFAARQQKTQR